MEKKNIILKSFLELIIKNGFHATPMSLVAKASGVAIGTIYHYFETKEQIIEELYTSLKQKMGSIILLSYDPNLEYKDRFFTLCKGVYNYFILNSSDFLFFEQYTNSPYISSQTKEETIQHYQFIMDFFEEGIKNGILKDLPVYLLFILTYGNLATLIKHQLRNEIEINDSIFESTITMIWDGIKK